MRGFSVAELIVVVAVIGLVMAVGMPTFVSYWRTSTVKAGAQELIALLNNGRQLAIRENESVCVKADVASPSYGTRLRYLRGSCAATQTCTATAGVSPCIWTGAGTDSNGYVTLSNDMQVQPPATDVLFTYLGAANPGGTFSVRWTNNTGATATVTLAASGRVNYAFP
jgi:Tfp pilus assembly protein FimT